MFKIGRKQKALTIKSTVMALALALLAASALVCLDDSRAQAQDAPQVNKTAAKKAPPTVPLPDRLKKLEDAIAKIGEAFKQKTLSDAQLLALRAQLDPLQAEGQAVSESLESNQAAAKKRLDQLGPEPKKDAAPEAATVAQRRAELKANFSQVDGLYKRAKVALVQTKELETKITNRRREILQSVLLKKSHSALHPQFWYDAAQKLPGTLQSIAQLINGWIELAKDQLDKGYWLKFGLFLAGLFLVWWILWTSSRRVLPRREASDPDAYEKVTRAIWVAAVVFAVPTLVAIFLFEGLRYFNLIITTFEPLAAVLLQSVQRVALTAGLARGLLAPAKSHWRLINVDTQRAKRLSRLAVRVMIIVAAVRILEVLFVMTAAPLAVSQLLLVVGTLAVAITIAVTLYGTAHVAAQLDAELGPIVEAQPAMMGFWRLAIWSAVVAIFAANIVGYFNVADFVVNQLVRVTFIAVIAFVLVRLTSAGLTKALEPDSFAGSFAFSTFGIGRQAIGQIAIVLTGLFRLLIYVVAGVALLTPLGVETVSVASTMNALFFGFNVGGIRISLTSLLIALLLLIGGYLAAKAFQGWLEQSYLPNTDLDAGLQNSISTSAKYLGIIAAIAFSLGYLGLNYEKLALVAGALSLGIGFGLQAIVSNFVSGLILLWERSIKVGDWVVVGSDEGYVRRINVRSTEIETFDRQMVIVPNSNLMTGVVKNWVRNNTTGRVIVPIGVSYDTDPDQVRDILLSCAKTHDLVMVDPPPYVIFAGFGDSSLDFELRCYIGNIENALDVRSHMRFEIFRRLKEANIEIPFPQRDINLRDIEKLAAMTRQGPQSDSGSTPESK